MKKALKMALSVPKVGLASMMKEGAKVRSFNCKLGCGGRGERFNTSNELSVLNPKVCTL